MVTGGDQWGWDHVGGIEDGEKQGDQKFILKMKARGFLDRWCPALVSKYLLPPLGLADLLFFHRGPRQRGCGPPGQGEPRPAFWHWCLHRGPLRPLPPARRSPPPPSIGLHSISASARLWLWLRGPGRAAPATSSLPARELAAPAAGLGIELSAPSAGGLGLCLYPS